MLEPKYKDIATGLGYEYQYGSEEWQNLQDLPDDTLQPFEDKQIYMMNLWHDEEDILNEYNGKEGATYVGEFYLMVRSKIYDESGETKWNDFVKNMYAKADAVREQFQQCEGWTVRRFKKIELYNRFDTNMDGIKVQYTIDLKTY